MKCGACGAIGSSSQRTCEFCGNNLVGSVEPGVAAASGATGAPLGEEASRFTNYVKDSLNLIKELSRSPSGGFNIWAFFFAVPYLWGYGARDNAKSVATVLIVPQILAKILIWFLGYRIAGAVFLAQIIWTIYVSWMVSTRVRLLTRTDQAYDWGQGILAFIVIAIISSILGDYGYGGY